ncbi:MAG: hypothetical protein ACPGSD_03355 [Flavobacteriales bacterium]
MNSAIGGYFDLELNNTGSLYHDKAIALNSGRNALEYVLKAQGIKHVYLPYFTCDVLLTPINRQGITYSLYSIDQNFEPIFDYSRLIENNLFLYVNYFGLKGDFIPKLAFLKEKLIVDNSQAFFELPYSNLMTFYSARKFFGVPDGAFLYGSNILDEDIEQGVSFNRMKHLLVRKDQSAEQGFFHFLENDKAINDEPIESMSKLTSSILRSIPYSKIAVKRRFNYLYLNRALAKLNKLQINLEENAVPIAYPFWTDDETLRDKLLNQRIYTPQYWPNVLKWSQQNSFEYQLVKNVLYLPVDQRYTNSDLDKVIKTIIT